MATKAAECVHVCMYGIKSFAGCMQYDTKEELYQQLIRCDIIIYHIVDDAAVIDEAVWAVSRKENDRLTCFACSGDNELGLLLLLCGIP